MTGLFSSEVHRQNRQLSGFALTLDSVEVAEAGHAAAWAVADLDNKKNRMSDIIEDQTNEVLMQWRTQKETRVPIPNAVRLFRNALLDARLFSTEIADIHPGLSDERIFQITTHPRSIQTLAAFAAHASTESRKWLRAGDPFMRMELFKRFMKASLDVQAVDPDRHCPEVRIENGKAVPSPHFKRFVPWAAAVAIHSLPQFMPPHPAFHPTEQSA